MKQKLLLGACILATSVATAQWQLNGNPAAAGNYVGTNNLQPLNIKTNLNEPILFLTNNANRMKLNHTVSYPVNSSSPTSVRDGFLLLGSANSNLASGGTLYGAANNRGAFSLLHLNGINGNNQAEEDGFRDWMKYGIFSTHNQDGMFMGQRSTDGQDITDAVFAWMDNSAPGGAGPDNMVFNFLAGPDNTAGLDLTGSNNFGREIMRLTAQFGYIGMGPRFSNAYQPTSFLHLHKENDTSAWIQITNQYLTAAASQTVPTPIAHTNGLRMGILGDPVQVQNGNAFIYNQELRHLIFSTNHATPVFGTIATNSTNERMRITSFNAPTNLPTGGTAYGTYIPVGSTANNSVTLEDITRVGISWSPATPVTRPLSLLHLGFPANSFNTAVTALDGWRPWMDIGTFTNSGIYGTSMYSGVKFAPGTTVVEPLDAVVGWGSPSVTVPTNGYARMRFLFTVPTTSTYTAGTANGIEAAHYWTDGNNTRMGVGDFQTEGFNLIPPVTDPLNTLQILPSQSSPYWNYPTAGAANSVSGLRFTNLTSASTVVPTGTTAVITTGTLTTVVTVDNTKVLSVDNNGDVVLVKGGNAAGTIIGANNGTSVSTNTATPNLVVLGQDFAQYTATVSPAITINPAQFITNRGVPMNGQSIIFSDGNIAPGIPLLPQSATPNALGNTFSIGNSFNPFSAGFGNAPSKFYTGNFTYNIGGIFVTDLPLQDITYFPNSTFNNIGPTGVAGYSKGHSFDYLTGVYGFADNTGVSPPLSPISGGGIAGVRGEANSSITASGVMGIAAYAGSFQNIGGLFVAGNANGNNIAIQAYVEGTSGLNYAGDFEGDVYVNGTTSSTAYLFTSDSTLKNNINPITNALSTINQLQPKSFYFDTTNTVGLNLSSKKQYGFVAQGVNRVLPELVYPTTKPATYDNTGNIITPAFTYSSLNYNAFIGLLTAGMQQQQQSIDSLRTNVTTISNIITPATPVLVSPTNGANGNFPKLLLTWNSVSKGVVLYHAQVATDNAFTNIVSDQSGITDTTTEVGLSCDTINITYYWRINAQNSNTTSAWSNVFSFTDTSKCAGIGAAPAQPIKKINAVSFNSASDSLFKTNVTPLTNSLTKVTQLNGVNYDWLHNNPKYDFDSTHQIGFIAQDVQKVVPQVVTKDVNGYLAVDYGRMAPLLVEAIKTLKAQLDSMKAVMASCCANNSRTSQTGFNNATTIGSANQATAIQTTTLSDANIIVLNQNQPNPFAEQTTITYNIPQTTNTAALLFYDINGKQIQNVNITTKGKGQLNVYANDLTNGVYSYTLIVDGQIIDTKKMVKQQ